MPLKDDLSAKIAADREAGRDVPPVIEELFMMLGEFLDPDKTEADDKPEPTDESKNPAPILGEAQQSAEQQPAEQAS